MAQRYREFAARSQHVEMANRWRAIAAEYDELAEATDASPPDHRTSMERQPMQQQQQKKLEDET